jgi:sugar phosphate isomerase/epimerase
MTTRRDFIKQSSLLTAGFFVNKNEFFQKQTGIGVQLYTLRDTIGKDPKGVLAQVASLGYKQVETFGYNNGKWFGLTPSELSTVLKDNGLSSPSGHTFGGTMFLKDGWQDRWKQAATDSKALGQEYIVIPYLENNGRTPENYKIVADGLNKAAEICKSVGIKLAYHNHDFEFADNGGETGLGILMKNTDPKLVSFELDIYWAKKSGNDPLALFKKYPGRFTMWHIKDMDNTEKKFFTEVGNGVIEWKPIFAAAKQSGMKYFFVEQDVCPGPPIESITKSIEYLKKNIVKS